MSDAEKRPVPAEIEENLARMKRSLGGRVAHTIAWIFGGLSLLLLVLLGGFAWYSTTADFNQRVGKAVEGVLENATGGRVELKKISFNMWHLTVEADGLVIHGLEGPGVAPYLSADKIEVRVKIFSFFSHVAETGIASHIGLNYLRVDHPQVHLIVGKDGKTNQPVPKHPTTSNKPLIDTLLDLKVTQAELANGVFLLNDRPIPFDLAARDLDVEVHYISSSDHYGATVDLKDLRTKLDKEPEADSTLHVEAELGRDMAELKKLVLHTGNASNLNVSASLHNFAHPDWQASVDGSLELKQIAVLSGVDGLKAGTVDLNLRGHSCGTTPAAAQKHPKFWQRLHPKSKAKPSTKVLPPDPDCVAGYLLVGVAKIHKAGYRDPYVRLHDVDGSAQLHITPTELLLTALTGYLPGGGSASGELRISNWLGEVPANAPATSPTTKAAVTTTNTTAKAVGAKPPLKGAVVLPQVQAHAYLVATMNRIPLRTIMDITAQSYGDLGFDTAVSGPVKMEWGGPAKNIADTVVADGTLTFAPTGVRQRGALSDIPVTGQALVHYSGTNETVQIRRIALQTPQSNIDASGILGVNAGDPLTALRVDMTVRDLGEYNQLLLTLGLEGNGKKGAAAIPVVLHGALQFNGTARGAIRDLDVKGHLQAANVEAKIGTTDALIDSIVTDAEYSPNSGLLVASSTIKRGTAVLNLIGDLKPSKTVSRHGVATYMWDSGMAIDVKLQLADAQMADLLQIAGQQQKIPVTGTASANAHVTGTLKDLNGNGHISLLKGVAYGEPYDSAVADLTTQGQDIEANHVVLKLHGIQIAGNGGYNTGTEHVHGHIEGQNIVLSKFETVQRANPGVDGVLSVVADANGTLKEPGLKANLKLANVTVKGQPVGEAVVEAHTQGNAMLFTANSTLAGAKLSATGQVQLAGNYETQAKLTMTGLDIGKPLAMFGSGTLKAQSAIDGVVTVSGSLKTPKSLSGTAEFNPVDVKLQGIELKAAEPLRASLRNGTATVEQVHITGQDTDLRMSGTAQLFGATDPKGGTLNMKGNGSVSMALLHNFRPDLNSSGKVEFTVAAGGQVKKPALTGKVQFDNVNVAMDGIPNGLNNMNGTLVFNEDRLQVQSLTATTGGGQLKIGGYLRYSNGMYADLTATGDVVRVRLYGLSATATAKLRLQGSMNGAQLSGTVLLTRFGVGQNVDLAAFASTGGISAPPDPNALSNKIRLDVRVTSSPQLDFQNSYAKLAGTVDLTIRGTVATPSVLGRIQITDGSATFAGTKYQLQRGDIYFTNPVRIDPIIDLDATAQVENYDITIGLHGTMTNLKPTYRSEPPLSEADVFALLALGRTQEEAQIYQE
ncbi:MAG: translocation/assembly module TamB domain-containing protein, partial [Edaphobacter sp.]